MRRCAGAMVLVAMTAMAGQAAAPPAKGPGDFTRAQSAWLDRAAARIESHAESGRFAEAEQLARERLALRERVQGKDHWQARDARLDVERWARLARLPEEAQAEAGRAEGIDWRADRELMRSRYASALALFRQARAIREKALGTAHPDVAGSHDQVGFCLVVLGKPDEALPLHKKALGVNEKALGAEHPQTATCCFKLALCLNAQGKNGDALPFYRRALAIRQMALGAEHPLTAQSYDAVGACLKGLGKYAEALPLHKKALAIVRKAYGDDHVATAASYASVASCLNALGKEPEALPLHRKALAIAEKAFGDDHFLVSRHYDNLAGCLLSLGRAGEALALYRKSLAIKLKALGPEHVLTATSYNDVALCLQTLGSPAEALPLHRKALAIREKALPADHPALAVSYTNVAGCLTDQGKHSEALPLLRKVLAIRQKGDDPDLGVGYNNLASCLGALGDSREALLLSRKALAAWEKSYGPDHAETAAGYHNVACRLMDQGEYAQALPLFRKALGFWEKTVGGDHPSAAVGYNSLAYYLHRQGRHAEAARLWQQSMPSQEAARFHRAGSGFDRALAQAGDFSPHACLAVTLARLRQPRNAFAHAEAGLARGLLDDLPSDPGRDGAEVRLLLARLKRLDAALIALAGLTQPKDEQRASKAEAVRQQREITSRLARLASEASARQVLPLSRIQRAIPADGALVLWLDVHSLGERWGCVVRREGPPRWERILGAGKEGAWTAEDSKRRGDLYRALRDPDSAAGERSKLLAAFAKQRLDPLRPHLKAAGELPAVRRLFVVPIGAMAYVPAELLDEGLAVSYVPSGSMLARLAEGHRALDGSALLGVGDPAFDAPAPAEPPAAGVLVKSVQPGSHADKAGLRAGDVLLRIGPAAVESFEDLDAALAKLPATATYWREGERLTARLPAGPLGAAFDRRSARAAVRAWRKGGELARRGSGLTRLPGTRVEVEAVSKLVKTSTLLLGSDASEQRLDELNREGKLKTYRILHFATHGRADNQTPGRSALHLAEDKLPDALEQARRGGHVYDGRLTVSRIRTEWKGKLDCDLVVLSACETGLGKDAGGDGLLGFAQAFLSAGARSVVLSRWPVDDLATSLLMRRFYQNLLGERQGLKEPMGRAAALREAKDWLRKLAAKEAEKAIESLPRGKLVSAPKGQARTYGHPYYWAAFTLIGDPD